MESAVYGKVRRRLLPFLFLLYVVAYLDRINVGFAALQMNRELGLSEAVFGLGAGIFFLGYFVFEIPSNLVLQRLGARIWISRIMISWGVAAIAMMFTRGARSFYLLPIRTYASFSTPICHRLNRNRHTSDLIQQSASRPLGPERSLFSSPFPFAP